MRTKIFTNPSGDPTIEHFKKLAMIKPDSDPGLILRTLRSKNYVGNNWEEILSEAQVK